MAVGPVFSSYAWGQRISDKDVSMTAVRALKGLYRGDETESYRVQATSGCHPHHPPPQLSRSCHDLSDGFSAGNQGRRSDASRDPDKRRPRRDLRRSSAALCPRLRGCAVTREREPTDLPARSPAAPLPDTVHSFAAQRKQRQHVIFERARLQMRAGHRRRRW